MANRKDRLQYFDMLKGIAIFMVVMGHVITFCVREIDRAAIFKFIGEIHMPLFFFISGWFTWHGGRGPSLGKRALQLLVPMVVCSSLWVWYFPHSGLESPLDSTFCGLWGSEWKNGYWFTLVLFEIILVYAFVRPMLCKCKGLLTEALLWLSVFAVLYAADMATKGSVFNSWMSLSVTSTFLLVFALGVVAARHSSGFMMLVRKPAVYSAAMIIGAVTLYMRCWYWEFPAMSLQLVSIAVALALHASLAIIGVGITAPWAAVAFSGEKPRPLAAIWAYIGRKSLAIYLLHYFFLFPLGSMREALMSVNVAFVPVLVFSAIVAAVIIGVVLCVERVLQPSPVLSWLLCGSLPKFVSKKSEK